MITRAAIREARRKGHAATCVELAQRWLIDHPHDLGVIHDYANMLYEMTRYDDAILIYEDALERFPEHRWGIYNQLGHLHRYRGAMEQAESAYQSAIDEDPEEATSYIFLGAVQARQGKLKAAEQTHRVATQCPEGFVDEAFHNLGLVLRGQGRLEEARDCFEKAIEIDPDYKVAYEALEDVIAAIEWTDKD